jgi:hypothetical protein
VLLLWFVPHLLQQQALRSAGESAQLREMLLDMLNEQEAVTMRQAQLGTSISYLQDQLEQIAAAGISTPAQQVVMPIAESAELRKLEERLSVVQGQIQSWLDGRKGAAKMRAEQDNASWAHLMGLLSAIQERVGEISQERSREAVGVHARTLLEDLEQEMSNLRSISEDIARLQWRLRRSLSDREAQAPVLSTTTANGRVQQRA